MHYGAFRFGWDSPARIATSTTMLAESTALLPAEPMYQPLVPFLPVVANGGMLVGGSSSNGEDDEWKQYPGKLDLCWYQGDDVQIPMFFSDPSDWEIDMSTAAGWEWKAQIRVIHRYWSTLVNDLAIAADYIPPDPEAEQPQGITQVTCFLPRYLNKYVGDFHWDIRSKGPFTGPTFPTPPLDLPEDEPWPPTDQIKTWLYGTAHVVPRVTDTDWLPPPAALVADGGQVVVMTAAGWCVGPNGRVP